jgi:opacity protein-like surface antigen
MDLGYVVGVTVGYSFVWPGYAGAIRVEAEAMYRKHDDGEFNSQWTPISDNADSFSVGHETVPYDGKLDIASGMFNVLVDIPTGTRFTPYLGLGAGYSRIDVDGFTDERNRILFDFDDPDYDQTIYALSWQAIVGVSFQLSQSLAITLEGRHFRLAADRWSELFFTEELSDSVTFGDWSIGFRVTF